MANAKNMTNEERGVKAAMERWHPSVPRATHSGILLIADQEIACDVLENGKRILRQNTFLKAMGKAKPAGPDAKRAKEYNLPVFLIANNLTPYLKQEILERAAPIFYKSSDGRRLIGYEATILPEACKVYVQADHDNVFTDSPQQAKIAAVCKAMLYGLATVGITSLVDCVTGYEKSREKTELQKILDKYISQELREWTRKFPDEFFKQVYRIHGWEYLATKNGRPGCIGHFINKYIYEKLPEGILDELKNKNKLSENGHRKFKHHQFLTEDIGDDNLKKQLVQTITVMKLSETLVQFKKFIDRI